MPVRGSITHLVDELKKGSPAAAQGLWERYFPQLVRLARERLRAVPGRMADEEDIALSVMDRFCRAAQQGRFPDLADRDDLWRLLLTMTTHRAADLARHETCRRRGGSQVPGELGFRSAEMGSEELGPAGIIDDSPSPEFAAMMADECRRLLELLGDPQLRAIALTKMEGYDNQEIARQLNCSLRTVERRLKLIRDRWRQEIE
ncbi:MAG: ECF-type sigma factor [Planctomycetota bacterium]|jgi:DNA-directed RNA polymerase specialized sigma24 family protein